MTGCVVGSLIPHIIYGHLVWKHVASQHSSCTDSSRKMTIKFRHTHFHWLDSGDARMSTLRQDAITSTHTENTILLGSDPHQTALPHYK
ncbi:hypothetical protein Pelo_7096 [Pelomyxa schiedti]|nr:hypothetical protein Pelo_7096 [Pelomyxa schiedti]